MTLVDARTGEVVPALQVMPELDPETRAALRHSIVRFGIVEPIIVTQEGQIIDGHNRWAIAQELGVPCPSTEREVSSEQEALELAYSLNMDRRHLDRGPRAAMAKSMRDGGFSMRAIAGALGTSPQTVMRDLAGEELPTVPCGTVGSSDGEPEPSRVASMDGKSRPAKNRQRSTAEKAQLVADYEAAKGDDAAMSALVEAEGFSTVATLATAVWRYRKQLTDPAANRGKLSEEERVEQITAAAAAGLSSHQIAQKLGIGFPQVRTIASRNNIDVPADAVVGKTRRIDSTRITSETVTTLEAVASSLRLVEPDDLNLDDCDEWVTSLTESLRVLNRFRNQLKEMTRGSE